MVHSENTVPVDFSYMPVDHQYPIPIKVAQSDLDRAQLSDEEIMNI